MVIILDARCLVHSSASTEVHILLMLWVSGRCSPQIMLLVSHVLWCGSRMVANRLYLCKNGDHLHVTCHKIYVIGNLKVSEVHA